MFSVIDRIVKLLATEPKIKIQTRRYTYLISTARTRTCMIKFSMHFLIRACTARVDVYIEYDNDLLMSNYKIS